MNPIPQDLDEEEKTFAWKMHGMGVTSGTLSDYAKAVEHIYYYNDFGLTTALWDGDAVHTATIRRQHTDDRDYIHYEVLCGGETAHFAIDGRA